MKAKLNSLWQKISKPLEILGIILVCLLAIILLIVIALAYIFNVKIPGLRGKTIWDWLQLLIIPAVLAIGGYLFNYTTSRNEREAVSKRDQTEREIATDNQQEAALQVYIDKISELLLEKHLRESQPQDEVRTIARVRTLTTLPRLDEKRKGDILRFLYESKLIDKDNTIINLEGADFNGVNLGEVNLSRAYLSQVHLNEARLSGADLREANLSEANLSEALLVEADLRGADLSEANLSEAYMFRAKLDKAYLREANLLHANLSKASLSGAKLGKVHMAFANLSLADLSEAYLSGAYLLNTTLRAANLTGADLSNADLSRADLSNAKLSEADLSRAIVTQYQLDGTHSLRDTILPDGSKNES